MSTTTQLFFADALVVGHLTFVIFAIFGALLVLRWRWIVVAHLPSVVWVIYVAASNATCPLTHVENELRESAGQTGYRDGFIDHYVMPILYPEGLTDELQLRLGVGILVLNLCCYGLLTFLLIRARRARRLAALDQTLQPAAPFRPDAEPLE